MKEEFWINQVKVFYISRSNNRSALPVTVFRSDETPPELISFILDLNSGILWLTLSETVDASTLNYSFLTLLNTSPRSSEPDTSLTLSLSSSTWDRNLSVQLIRLSTEDLNELKQLLLLATDVNNTYISLEVGGISDVFGNPVIEVNTTHPLVAFDFYDDITHPYLPWCSVTLNLVRLQKRRRELKRKHTPKP